MSYGYSNDLRERVFAYYDDNHGQENTCEVFQISRATLNNWLRLRRETGSIELPVRPLARNSKIKRADLETYLAEHPDAYLEEIGAVLGVTGSAIYYACQRWGLVRKKSKPLTKKATLNNAPSSPQP
jgi:transposase